MYERDEKSGCDRYFVRSSAIGALVLLDLSSVAERLGDRFLCIHNRYLSTGVCISCKADKEESAELMKRD